MGCAVCVDGQQADIALVIRLPIPAQHEAVAGGGEMGIGIGIVVGGDPDGLDGILCIAGSAGAHQGVIDLGVCRLVIGILHRVGDEGGAIDHLDGHTADAAGAAVVERVGLLAPFAVLVDLEQNAVFSEGQQAVALLHRAPGRHGPGAVGADGDNGGELLGGVFGQAGGVPVRAVPDGGHYLQTAGEGKLLFLGDGGAGAEIQVGALPQPDGGGVILIAVKVQVAVAVAVKVGGAVDGGAVGEVAAVRPGIAHLHILHVRAVCVGEVNEDAAVVRDHGHGEGVGVGLNQVEFVRIVQTHEGNSAVSAQPDAVALFEVLTALYPDFAAAGGNDYLTAQRLGAVGADLDVFSVDPAGFVAALVVGPGSGDIIPVTQPPLFAHGDGDEVEFQHHGADADLLPQADLAVQLDEIAVAAVRFITPAQNEAFGVQLHVAVSANGESNAELVNAKAAVKLDEGVDADGGEIVVDGLGHFLGALAAAQCLSIADGGLQRDHQAAAKDNAVVIENGLEPLFLDGLFDLLAEAHRPAGGENLPPALVEVIADLGGHPALHHFARADQLGHQGGVVLLQAFEIGAVGHGLKVADGEPGEGDLLQILYQMGRFHIDAVLVIAQVRHEGGVVSRPDVGGEDGGVLRGHEDGADQSQLGSDPFQQAEGVDEVIGYLQDLVVELGVDAGPCGGQPGHQADDGLGLGDLFHRRHVNETEGQGQGALHGTSAIIEHQLHGDAGSRLKVPEAVSVDEGDIFQQRDGGEGIGGGAGVGVGLAGELHRRLLGADIEGIPGVLGGYLLHTPEHHPGRQTHGRVIGAGAHHAGVAAHIDLPAGVIIHRLGGDHRLGPAGRCQRQQIAAGADHIRLGHPGVELHQLGLVFVIGKAQLKDEADEIALVRLTVRSIPLELGAVHVHPQNAVAIGGKDLVLPAVQVGGVVVGRGELGVGAVGGVPLESVRHLIQVAVHAAPQGHLGVFKRLAVGPEDGQLHGSGGLQLHGVQGVQLVIDAVALAAFQVDVERVPQHTGGAPVDLVAHGTGAAQVRGDTVGLVQSQRAVRIADDGVGVALAVLIGDGGLYRGGELEEVELVFQHLHVDLHAGGQAGETGVLGGDGGGALRQAAQHHQRLGDVVEIAEILQRLIIAALTVIDGYDFLKLFGGVGDVGVLGALRGAPLEHVVDIVPVVVPVVDADALHQAQLAAQGGDGLCGIQTVKLRSVIVGDHGVGGGGGLFDLVFQGDLVHLLAAHHQIQRAAAVDGDDGGGSAPGGVRGIFRLDHDDVLVLQAGGLVGDEGIAGAGGLFHIGDVTILEDLAVFLHPEVKAAGGEVGGIPVFQRPGDVERLVAGEQGRFGPGKRDLGGLGAHHDVGIGAQISGHTVVAGRGGEGHVIAGGVPRGDGGQILAGDGDFGLVAGKRARLKFGVRTQIIQLPGDGGFVVFGILRAQIGGEGEGQVGVLPGEEGVGVAGQQEGGPLVVLHGDLNGVGSLRLPDGAAVFGPEGQGGGALLLGGDGNGGGALQVVYRALVGDGEHALVAGFPIELVGPRVGVVLLGAGLGGEDGVGLILLEDHVVRAGGPLVGADGVGVFISLHDGPLGAGGVGTVVFRVCAGVAFFHVQLHGVVLGALGQSGQVNGVDHAPAVLGEGGVAVLRALVPVEDDREGEGEGIVVLFRLIPVAPKLFGQVVAFQTYRHGHLGGVVLIHRGGDGIDGVLHGSFADLILKDVGCLEGHIGKVVSKGIHGAIVPLAGAYFRYTDAGVAGLHGIIEHIQIGVSYEVISRYGAVIILDVDGGAGDLCCTIVQDIVALHRLGEFHQDGDHVAGTEVCIPGLNVNVLDRGGGGVGDGDLTAGGKGQGGLQAVGLKGQYGEQILRIIVGPDGDLQIGKVQTDAALVQTARVFCEIGDIRLLHKGVIDGLHIFIVAVVRPFAADGDGDIFRHAGFGCCIIVILIQRGSVGDLGQIAGIIPIQVKVAWGSNHFLVVVVFDIRFISKVVLVIAVVHLQESIGILDDDAVVGVAGAQIPGALNTVVRRITNGSVAIGIGQPKAGGSKGEIALVADRSRVVIFARLEGEDHRRGVGGVSDLVVSLHICQHLRDA